MTTTLTRGDRRESRPVQSSRRGCSQVSGSHWSAAGASMKVGNGPTWEELQEELQGFLCWGGAHASIFKEGRRLCRDRRRLSMRSEAKKHQKEENKHAKQVEASQGRKNRGADNHHKG